jgi:hypothetical protein
MDINKDFSQYTITNIYSECLKTNPNMNPNQIQYPCYHSVNIKINQNERIVNNCLLSSETIAEYYKYYNINIPFHFSDRSNGN